MTGRNDELTDEKVNQLLQPFLNAVGVLPEVRFKMPQDEFQPSSPMRRGSKQFAMAFRAFAEASHD